MNAAERRIYDALIKAIDAHGKRASDFSWLWVTEEEWRNAAMEMTISTGSADSQRRAFRRNANRLLERGIVAMDKNRVWNVKKDQTDQTTADKINLSGQK